jgi:glucokinase
MGMYYAAVDLGATNVRVAYGSASHIIEKASEKTDRAHGVMGVPAQIIRMIKGFGIDRLEAIGVGSIGPLDISTGRVKDTPNLPIGTIPVVDPLTEEFQVPVGLLNDCSAAVLGEFEFGAGMGLRNLAYVTLSTGLGGGAIVDGHLLIGKDGNAVEIGHLTIDPDSPLICGCGCRGHWEAYCSGNNIPNFVKLLLEEREGESLLLEMAGGKTEGITTELLFDAAQKGDQMALEIVSEIGRINAVGFANVVNAYDPELVTVGGSIALRNPELVLGPIIENIGGHLLNRMPEIMITPLGEDIVLYGALAMARGTPATI